MITQELIKDADDEWSNWLLMIVLCQGGHTGPCIHLICHISLLQTLFLSSLALNNLFVLILWSSLTKRT